MEGRDDSFCREESSRDVVHLHPEALASASAASHPLPGSRGQTAAATDSGGGAQENPRFPILSHQPGDVDGFKKPAVASIFRSGAAPGKLDQEGLERPSTRSKGKKATFNLQGNTLHEIASRSDQRREAQADDTRDKERAREEQRRLIERQLRFQKACDSARYLVQCRIILHNIAPSGREPGAEAGGKRDAQERRLLQGTSPEKSRKTEFLEIAHQPAPGEADVLGEEGEEETTFLLRSIVGFLKPEELSDVALERESLGKCGFFLCTQQMPTGAQKRGRLSLVRRWRLDHRLIRVADEDDLLLFCSKECYHRQKELQGLQREEHLYTRPFVQQWVSRVSSRCRRDSWRDVADPGVCALALASVSSPDSARPAEGEKPSSSVGAEDRQTSVESHRFACEEDSPAAGAAQSLSTGRECLEQERRGGSSAPKPQGVSCSAAHATKGDSATSLGTDGDERADRVEDTKEPVHEGTLPQTRDLTEPQRERKTEEIQSEQSTKTAHAIRVTVEEEEESSQDERAEASEVEGEEANPTDARSSRPATHALFPSRERVFAPGVSDDYPEQGAASRADKRTELTHSQGHLDKEERPTQADRLLILQWGSQRGAAGFADPVVRFDYAEAEGAKDLPLDSSSDQSVSSERGPREGLMSTGRLREGIRQPREEDSPCQEDVGSGGGNQGGNRTAARVLGSPGCTSSAGRECGFPAEASSASERGKTGGAQGTTTVDLSRGMLRASTADASGNAACGLPEEMRKAEDAQVPPGSRAPRTSDVDSASGRGEWEEGEPEDELEDGFGLATDLNEFLDLTDDDTDRPDTVSPDVGGPRAGPVCSSQQDEQRHGERGKVSRPPHTNEPPTQSPRGGSRRVPPGRQSVKAELQEAYGRLSDLSVVWDLLGNWSRNETREFLLRLHGLTDFSRSGVGGGDPALSSFRPASASPEGLEVLAGDTATAPIAATAEDIQRIEQLVQALLRVLPRNLAQHRRHIVDLCRTFRIQRAAPPLQPSCCRAFVAVVLIALQCCCWTSSSSDPPARPGAGTPSPREGQRDDSPTKNVVANIAAVKSWLGTQGQAGDDEGLREFILDAVFDAASKPADATRGEDRRAALRPSNGHSGQRPEPHGCTGNGQMTLEAAAPRGTSVPLGASGEPERNSAFPAGENDVIGRSGRAGRSRDSLAASRPERRTRSLFFDQTAVWAWLGQSLDVLVNPLTDA
ncbi:conserved hypothetical protein [Neospora caninum Liverpool]|uniref:RNA polymerase II subunit B1 CTD phosphatase RPAP2 homolog n=1 Tax=Neospora caninum (strain Liverpool) TaxID=572307 RepID=F0VHD7_NEOCL|nr:conserved hypothetical protein [Neospora caninum Liverpool]CBZ53131.1 conserved hypothetical protein [Neospora caninum Liverpool]CEL67119.1 TPA: hypothetical protein BN1204_029190 [Neospora caninum Liverpool]|eukprot:XP_003883163.1 conserved hypothetical protein [Neospora caninum Liverpool]